MTKLITFLLIFICFSCSFLVQPKETFVIKNQTSKDIKILFFIKSALTESVDIIAGKQYEKEINIMIGSTTSPFNEKTDSLIVKFSDNKYLRQYCQGLSLYGNFDKCFYEKNLMDFATGSYVKSKISGKVTRTITFDESDYQRAKPL
jgi:hypothetical protein